MKKRIRLTESELVQLISKIIKEDESVDATTVEQELGLPPLTPEIIDSLVGCESDDSDVPQEHQGEVQQIGAAIETASVPELKGAFKKLRAAIKNARAQRKLNNEQLEAAAVTILGVPLGTAALIAIGVLLLLKILGKLLKGGREKPGCRAGEEQMKNEFGRKITF